MKRQLLSTLCIVAACSSDAADPPATDAGTFEDSGTSADSDGSGNEGDGAPRCSAEKGALLGPIASVSSGEIAVLGDVPGGKLVYVDASAGGTQASVTQPRLYIALSTLTKVDVTDETASTSTAWDLGVKRPIFFSNGGDGGSGKGGSVLLPDRMFEDVTQADAKSGAFKSEQFFDAACTPQLDANGSVKTSFDGWYDYDLTTNILQPHPGTWLVRGAAGAIFKVQILSYYAIADGGTGQAGGRYTMKIGAL